MALAVVLLTGACSRSVGHDDSAAPGPSSKDEPLRIDTELISALSTFDECDDLLTYLRTEGAKAVGPYGFEGGYGFRDTVAFGTAATTMAPVAAARAASGEASADDASGSGALAETGAAPPVAGTDFSATNVQEAGVDEPDVVKTDGKRLVTIAGGQLRFVDLSGPEPRLAATLRLDETGYLQGDLLLSGDRVLVLRPAPFVPQPMPVPSPQPMPVEPGTARSGIVADEMFRQAGPPRTSVTVVDLADLAAPKIVSELTIDGDLVASRMVDGVARLVLRSGPPNLPFLFPSGSEASVQVAADANKKVIAESTLEQWLPTFTQDGGSARRLTDCGAVSRPEEFSGVGMLSVVTVDALDPRPGPASSVLGAGELVYASAEHLYVTTNVWKAADCGQTAECAASTFTDIHKFGIGDEVRTTYEASGRIPGRLLNQFSMSELGGDLRLASTDDATQESAVTVLRQNDRVLEQIGGVGGLGKTERIYAVRFLGDRGYVVTFRQTDPLYVIDLADPTKPAVTGELKIPGYSAYLHPIGDHRLLGIGQDATEQGRVQGMQLSLFDVADPANPKRLANATLPFSQSEAEYDHHAFLWWAKTGLAMVPVQSYVNGTSSAVGFTVTEDAVQELARVEHRDRQPIRRSIVVGDRVLTLSETGLQGSDLATLAARSWLPLS